VIDSLAKCQKTQVYLSDGRSCKTTIDSIIAYYQNDPVLDKVLLKEFFEYNDKIDQARNVKLVDYIPELDAGRKFLG
jgi:hypothetical protein